MRRVRCPGCSAVIPAHADRVQCGHCGLSGRVDAAGKQAKEPWTITIDLRKLRPKHWSAGARAFSVFLLLGVAFFAGGFTGVVFERTRSDVAADLDGELFGGQDSPTNGSGTTDEGTAKTADEGAASDDPPPPPEPTPETTSVTFTNDDASPQITLAGGLVRVQVAYDDQGSRSTFRLKFLQDDEIQRSLGASYSGPYETVRYLQMPAGTYDLEVGFTNDASTWRIAVEEPHGEKTSASGGEFSDHGDGGRGPFRLSGDTPVGFTASEQAAGTVTVQAFRADGTKIEGCGALGQSTSPKARYDDSWNCSVGEETLVYFDVQHPNDQDGTWTLNIR